MLTLDVAGILGLDEIRDVGWVLLWFGCTFNPSRILPLSAYADVALPGAGLFLCGSASISLLSSISVVNSSSCCGQGGSGGFMIFFFFFIFCFLLTGSF